MIVDLTTSKRLLDSGELVSAIVVPRPWVEEEQWVVKLEKANGETELFTRARTSDLKTYKSLRAAVRDAERIGLSEVRVQLTNS